MIFEIKKRLNLKYIFLKLSHLGLLKWMKDETFLKIAYKLTFNQKLDLTNPKTYNEKLQWLKLNNRKEILTKLVDKYEVKEYIKSTIGEEYLIPTIGVWDNFSDIDFDLFPNQFVLKTTHDSGGFVICTNKNNFDIKKARKKINRSLKRNYYYSGREWPYKNVRPRIIADEFLTQDGGGDLIDYRIFCFNGEPEFIALDFDINNKSKTKRNLYDLDWNLIDARIAYPNELSKTVKKPLKLKEMLDLARILSQNIPHVRVDFYYTNEKIYFGELTFYHLSGFGKIDPKSFNNKIGDLINIVKGENA